MSTTTTQQTLYDKIKEIRGETDDKTINKDGAWAAVGFAVVLIVVGVPVWWHTTTVYRADLPYSAIQEHRGFRKYHFVTVNVLALDYAECLQFTSSLQSHLNKVPNSVKYLAHCSRLLKEQQVAVKESANVAQLSERLKNNTVFHSGTLSILLLPSLGSTVNMDAIKLFVTTENLLIASHDADPTVVSTVIKSMVIYEDKSLSTRESQESVHKVVSEPSYSITLTLMLPQPHFTIAQWDSESAIKAYLAPLVEQLRSIHMNITVRCQRLYMTPLSGIRPQWLENKDHYALPHTHLPLAINAIEAKLGSFVSTDPALHFIIYVPTEQQTPLQIYGPDSSPLASNSFTVPRWGGVVIVNPPASARLTEQTKEEDLPLKFSLDSHHIMRVVLTQLHSLLPVPQLDVSAPGVRVESPSSTRMPQWQLDGLARARVSQYYQSTSTTLHSLCELVGEISNMVVSEEVGGWVWRSVSEWQACGVATQEGRLLDASLYCTDAHKYAHSAFFHPSMLALLYFPDNQKYAIYVPLFLPVSIPVLLSFKTLFGLAKHYWSKRKSKTE